MNAEEGDGVCRYSRRFRTPQQRESKYVKLVVWGEVVHDPEILHRVVLGETIRMRAISVPNTPLSLIHI